MHLLSLVFIVLVLLFGFVVAFGAPYLPTFKKQSGEALDLLDLNKGQTLLELGCGDGRVMRAAAARGLRAEGYELNPVLVIVAKIVTFKYRKTTKVHWGNYWRKTWPPADGIFVFLLDKYMPKLNKKIVQQQKHKPVKLVSFAFQVPGKEPLKTKKGLYLYQY